METANRLASVGRIIVKVLKVIEAIMFPVCDKTVSSGAVAHALGCTIVRTSKA
jgi:hypothetical protein